jgi:nitrogenase molybdenum-iron protein NifN
VDAHKYVYGKRVAVYGEEDLVVGIASFLDEMGLVPVICASGGQSGGMREALSGKISMREGEVEVLEDADFVDIAEAAQAAGVNLLIGNSRGFSVARRLDLPLIRVGMPVHDRVGAQRIQHLGYRGTQSLCDRIVNALIARDQERSEPGYMTM